MEFEIFGYQINPGRDHLLYFTASYDECVEAAKRQREELHSQADDLGGTMGAMAIYRCQMKVPDVKILIDVLNNPDDERRLFASCVIDRQLVGVIAD